MLFMTTIIILLLVSSFGFILYFLKKSTDNYIETLKEETKGIGNSTATLQLTETVKQKKVVTKKKQTPKVKETKQKAVKTTPPAPINSLKKASKKKVAQKTEIKPAGKKRGRPSKNN